MSEIPSNITAKDIEHAIQRIDVEGIPNNASSSTYDVIFNSKRYPPKLVISYANEYANGKELDRKSFKGGEGTDCFKILKRNGFIIQNKEKELLNREAFKSWVELNNKTDYLLYLDKFWTRVSSQLEKFPMEFESLNRNYSEFTFLLETKPSVYELDIRSLKSLKMFVAPFLNKRTGGSQGGSAESAGISQLIDWNESMEDTDSPTSFYKINLNKPFLLLAGISGTGKTRFVREQALMTGTLEENYCLVSVRPDWHEPSDLLGYVSRLNGTEFVVTDVLRFVVKAWIGLLDFENAFKKSESEWAYKAINEIKPFWLCLDEMNLAPVEQYFADYLSVLETRKWESGQYSCDALVTPGIFKQLESVGLNKLRLDLGLIATKYDALWAYFENNGISIPFNLMVAGTVNMDETTHGFSRKVIDRALTFDFGRFFPNESASFFEATYQPKALSFPLITQAGLSDLANVAIDSDGQKTIAFFDQVNVVLKDTMFELAYRALNELLMSVISFNPKDEPELQAIWDDFLMCKVLPRIEGDEEKLMVGSDALLDSLETTLNKMSTLGAIWQGEVRPDLLREQVSDPRQKLSITCRSAEKIRWMKNRLTQNGFTSFWP